MIRYSPGTWGVKFAFSLAGSVFPKAFAWAGPCALITGICHWILRSPEISDTLGLELEQLEVNPQIMSNYTFVLGFLIVFRANQAYSRWWEGGTLMCQTRGEWFNAFSCLIAFSNTSPERQNDVQEFQHLLVRLVSLLYGSAIQQVSTSKNQVLELIDIDGISAEHIQYMQGAYDRCEIVLQWIQKLIVEANSKEIVKIAPPILSRVYNQLGNGIVNLNNARKITDFPIPFPLAQMITIMLMYHWWVTCVVCAVSVRAIYWAVMLAFVIIFSFQSINYIALELEMPFGDDPNDLPLQDLQEDMNASLLALLHKKAMTRPDFEFKRKHLSLVTKLVDFDKQLEDMAHGTAELIETRPRMVRNESQIFVTGDHAHTAHGIRHKIRSMKSQVHELDMTKVNTLSWQDGPGSGPGLADGAEPTTIDYATNEKEPAPPSPEMAPVASVTQEIEVEPKRVRLAPAEAKVKPTDLPDRTLFEVLDQQLRRCSSQLEVHLEQILAELQVISGAKETPCLPLREPGNGDLGERGDSGKTPLHRLPL